MLLALALGGLAAAFAAPIVLWNDDDDDDVPMEIDGASDDETDLASVFDVAEDTLADTTFEVPAAPGAFEMEEFDPETDICRFEVDDADTMIEAGLDEDGVPFVTAGLALGDMTVTFPGLSELPQEAISVVVPAGEGDDPITLTLAEVLEFAEDAVDTPGDEIGTTGGLDSGGADTDDIANAAIDDDDSYVPGALPPAALVNVLPDVLDDLLAVGPTDGDAPDLMPDLLDDFEPVAAVTGDAPDILPEPLPDDVTPLAPVPADDDGH